MPEPRLPDWFRQPLPVPEALARMRGIVRRHGLNTVCEGARCPNLGRCWSEGAATFMILGRTCTRACRFCAVEAGKLSLPDPDEPRRVADAVSALGLNYAVITSVTRDDLPDQGAAHFAATVRMVRAFSPRTKIELLIPDLSAREGLLGAVTASGPDVIGHNIETVRRLAAGLRPHAPAGHERSLEVLRILKRLGVGLVKSGIMVGLGERDDEVLEALRELRDAGCDIVTVGQYLAPAGDGRQVPVARFVRPELFEMYRREGMEMGFAQVWAGPLVRSSFLAERVYAQVQAQESLRT